MGRRLVVTMCVFALAASACTGGGPSSRSSARAGGTLRVGVLPDRDCRFVICGSETADPQIEGVSYMSYELERCCLLRTLLSYNGKPTSEGGAVLRPDLAAGLPTITDDGRTWTFRLKRGINYAPPLQNTEITSGDFVRSIERLLSKPPSDLPPPYGDPLDSYAGDFLDLLHIIAGASDYHDGKADHISGLETPDPHTLVFHLTKPVGALGSVLSLPGTAPIPANPSDPTARFGVAEGHTRFYFSYLVASGPYMLEGARDLDLSKPPDRQLPAAGDGPSALVLVRNPSWDPSTDELRAAQPDRIVLTVVASPHDAGRLIRSGALDLVFDWDALPGQLGTRAIGAGTSSSTTLRDQVTYLDLNLAIPPLDDLPVRRAINFAIPRRDLFPSFEKAGFLAEPDTHIGLDSQEDDLLRNFDPYHAATGDLDAARREMARSRYDRDHDGRCDASVCRRLLMWGHRGAPGAEEEAVAVARDLRRIGIRVLLRYPSEEGLDSSFADYAHAHLPIRIDTWIKDLTTGATYFPFLFGSPPVAPQYYSLLGASPRQLHRWGYHVRSIPNVNDRIESCLRLAFELQVRCWAELDQYLTTEVVKWVPLVKIAIGRVVSARVRRFSFDQSDNAPAPSLDRVLLAPGPAPSPSPAVPGTVPAIPEGVYRTTITAADLHRFVGPRIDPNDVLGNTGTTTIYLRDGWFENVQTADHPVYDVITVGTYRGNGHRVVFDLTGPTNDAYTTPPVSWSFDGRALHLSWPGCGDLKPIDCRFIRTIYEAHPWVKVG